MALFTLKRMGEFEPKKDYNGNEFLVAWYEIPQLRAKYLMGAPYTYVFSKPHLSEFKFVPENYLDHIFFRPDVDDNAFEFISALSNKHGLNFDYHFEQTYNGNEKNTPYCVKITCEPKDLDRLEKFLDDLNTKFAEFEQQYKDKKREEQELLEKIKKEWEESEIYKRIQACNKKFPEEIR